MGFVSHTRRQPRYSVRVDGQYRSGRGVPRDVIIQDLSENGCRFFDKFGVLRPGTHLSMRIDSIGPVSGHVAWSTGQTVGVAFEEPLYGPVFEHIRDKVSAARNAIGAAPSVRLRSLSC